MNMMCLRPFRVKNVDLAYCGHCAYYKPVSRSRYDFCLYDGMPLEICPDEDIVFTCKNMIIVSHIQLDRFWSSFIKKTIKLC